MAEINYKEYSRLRSIARKRIERASAAGRAEYVRIPTVAEVRASANPAEYMNAVKTFLSDPGASLKASRQTGISLPPIEFTPLPPITRKEMTPEEKAERRREQKRRSKAKRAVEKAAENEKEARRRVGYLKALEKVTEDLKSLKKKITDKAIDEGKDPEKILAEVMKTWKDSGLDVTDWLGILSPKRAKEFVDYIEYRFSQGDFKHTYVIDVFIKDFGQMQKRQYTSNDLKTDFEAFLQKQKGLKKNQDNTNKYGIDKDEVMKIWKKFIALAKG